MLDEQPTIFIWQWGRIGAGPRYAYELAAGMRQYGDCSVHLSLSEQSEVYQGLAYQSQTDLPVSTFTNNSKLEIIRSTLNLPSVLRQVDEFVDKARPDVAICAMHGFWDLAVTRHFVKRGIPVITIVHDARSHPGDWFKPLYWLQERQISQSTGIITLTNFIAEDLQRKGLLARREHVTIPHIPFLFPDISMPAPVMPGYPERKPLRLLLAGRMQAYKGLNLFINALQILSSEQLQIRVVGTGSDPDLKNLATMNNIDVHNRWCTETELVDHIDWADVVVAPYIEASQSGIVSLALDRGRPVVAMPVGGLPEQVAHEISGIIADSVTAEGVAKAIYRFVDDLELFRQCAGAAMHNARKISDWQQIGPKFIELVNKVLA